MALVRDDDGRAAKGKTRPRSAAGPSRPDAGRHLNWLPCQRQLLVCGTQVAVSASQTVPWAQLMAVVGVIFASMHWAEADTAGTSARTAAAKAVLIFMGLSLLRYNLKGSTT